MEAVQSYFVELPTADEQAKRKRQFNKAMSALGLEPCIYPSQLQRTISASGDPKAKAKESSDRRDDSKDGELSQEEGSEFSTATRPADKMASWPRLIQMVSAAVSL